uniref:hypothetical protein n=1 Tax=Thaumasiovibrio occultus TaxID=1891184 RepID=UPI000B35BDBD|nr:hypothetical protein [Thaumasiovibrio occultus]
MKAGMIRLSTLGVLSALCLVAAPSWARDQSMPGGYSRFDMATNQMYPLERFPFKEYFVCIEKNAPDLAEYLPYDPVFKDALRQTAGEMAASWFRYFKRLPAKEALRDNVVHSGSFPPVEAPPFQVDGYQRTYTYQYMRQDKAQYQYSTQVLDFYEELWDRGEDRHWMATTFTFYQRESDYKVVELTEIGDLWILLSLDMDNIQQAQTEEQAYAIGYQEVLGYYYAADVEKCQ